MCVCVCVCPRARLTSVNNIHCGPVLCVSLCYGVSCIYLFLTPNSRSAFRAGNYDFHVQYLYTRYVLVVLHHIVTGEQISRTAAKKMKVVLNYTSEFRVNSLT